MFKNIFVVLSLVFITSQPAFAAKGKAKVSVAPLPPALSATVKFSEPSGNNILDGGETGALILTIQNTGKGDAFDVKAELMPDKSIKDLRFDRTVSIGTVSSGTSITKEIPLTAGEDVPTSAVSFNISVKEANGFDADPVKIAFSTKAFEPPKLIIADIGIDDQNGNGKVEPNEIVELTARIQNIGYGDARNVSVDVQPGANVFMAGDAVSHFELGVLKSGAFKDVKFSFYTNKRIKNGEQIPISLNITEARQKYNAVQPVNLVMNAPQKKIHEVVVKGDEQKPVDIAIAGGLSIDVDINVPSGEKASKHDIAVIIGNKNYTASGVPPVEYADRDAAIMREYLIKTFGYSADNIIYAADATVGKFNEIFGTENDHKGKLYKYIKKDISQVFIYYVGHGAPDLDSKDAYFVPVDANPQYIAHNGYRLQTFYNNIAKLSAKKLTVMIDACFSGSSDKGMLFKGISPLIMQVKKDYIKPANATVLTSAAPDQVSSWYPEKRHSLFTYYFLKGVQGDADTNKDKKITVAEMKEYLTEHVPYMAQRLTGNQQQPVINGDEKEIIVQLK